MKARDDSSFPMKNSADLDFSINVQKNTTNKIRQIFDNISLNVISFLEKHQGVTDVKFIKHTPVTHNQINEWETKHHPFKLPDEYKAFLLISDGFVLKWHMKYNREVLSLGNMSLGSLQSLQPVPFETDNNDQESIAFSLDHTNATDGRVAFVFSNTHTNPTIWFQDLSCEWNFICNKFSDYFRLMIMHLGLINWQYAYTKVGLNPVTMQWLRFLVPHRLDIDLRHNANGFGWILPKSTKNKNNSKVKRKKLTLDKIDQIVKTQQVNKDNKATKIKLTLPKKSSRPGSAPNRNQHFKSKFK